MGVVNIWEKLIEDTGNSSKVCAHCKKSQKGFFPPLRGAELLSLMTCFQKMEGKEPFLCLLLHDGKSGQYKLKVILIPKWLPVE